MTSQRKIDSNRRNAKRSTGPKTAAGKAASRKNAFKHGLAADQSSLYDPNFINEMARAISTEKTRLATKISETLDYIQRVQEQKFSFIAELNSGARSPLEFYQIFPRLCRYESRGRKSYMKAVDELEAAEEEDRQNEAKRNSQLSAESVGHE